MSKPMNENPSRRSILKAAAAGCGMMTQTSVMSTLLNLQLTKAVVANSSPTDYKALVCLFLFGGNDSFNMLMPRNNPSSSNPVEYNDYAASRGGYDNGTSNLGGLALLESDLLAINVPANLPGRSFGLHPGFGHAARTTQDASNNWINEDLGVNGGVAKLYNDGKLSFLSNVGSLIEPTTRTDYNNKVNLPLGLFSHADLQRHWMTGAPHTRSQITGWGGRLADLFISSNLNPQVSMNISINGVNLFQTGGAVIPYTIGESGATQVSSYTAAGLQNRIFKKYTDSILDQTYSDLLAKSFAESNRGAIDAAIEFNNQVNSVVLNTTFDQGDSLSRRMKKIAQVIAARGTLQQSRQVFFISLGGFDNHAGLLAAQNNLLPQISRALSSFYEAMVELGCESNVVTFTASDFSRTLGSNGQGSDHAWGANHMVMGGAVDGGKIFGDYPLSLRTPQDPVVGNLDLGRGRLIPTLSVDEMAAELAMWFGVSNETDLKTILPNIERFYSYSGGQGPVGFLL